MHKMALNGYSATKNTQNCLYSQFVFEWDPFELGNMEEMFWKLSDNSKCMRK